MCETKLTGAQCFLYYRLGRQLRDVTTDDVYRVTNGSKQKPRLNITREDLRRYNENGRCVIVEALIGLCRCRYFEGETFFTRGDIRSSEIEPADVIDRCPIPKLARELPGIG